MPVHRIVSVTIYPSEIYHKLTSVLNLFFFVFLLTQVAKIVYSRTHRKLRKKKTEGNIKNINAHTPSNSLSHSSYLRLNSGSYFYDKYILSLNPHITSSLFLHEKAALYFHTCLSTQLLACCSLGTRRSCAFPCMISAYLALPSQWAKFSLCDFFMTIFNNYYKVKCAIYNSFLLCINHQF